MKTWKTLSLGAVFAFSLTSMSAYSQNYNKGELDDLRNFLRQPSMEDGVSNFEQFGLTPNDTLEWISSTGWIGKLRINWIEINGEMRIQKIQWFKKNLSGKLSFRHCSELESVNMGSNDLTAVDFTGMVNLKTLTIGGNKKIKTVDVSDNTNLESLTVSETDLSEIDITGNQKLKTFSAQNTQIQDLNFSGNPLLESVYISDCTQLHKIDFSNNLSLKNLVASGCISLKSIDLSSLGNLYSLSLNETSIRELNISANVALSRLQCSSTGLESLILPDTSMLETLYIQNNRLTALPGLERLTTLKDFRANHNLFRTIDLSANVNLGTVYLYNNRLEEIRGLDQLKSLVNLQCHNNVLTDLSTCFTGKLRQFYVYNNKLSYSAIPIRETFGVKNSQYWFYPQYVLKGGAVTVGETIDLSKEAIMGSDATQTEFSWFDISSDNETPIELTSVANGVFQIEERLIGKTLRCKMTNTLFGFNNNQKDEAGFPIFYEIYVSGNESYHLPEIEQIKTFLRRPSTIENKTNAQLLGIDTLQWATQNTWLHQVPGVRLSGTNEIHVASIDWNGYGLAGQLDLSECQHLDSIDVRNNALTALELSENENLKKIYCQNNRLSISTLPHIKAEVFEMHPQADVELGYVDVSEGIDLSTEHRVTIGSESTETEYRWVEINREGEEIPVEGITSNNNGTFMLDETLAGKTLRVYLTNAAYTGPTSSSTLSLRCNVQVNRSEQLHYKQSELSQLKNFLRQGSGNDRNFLKLGLTVNDTLTWETSDAWVKKISGAIWTTDNETAQIESIDWSQKNLVGHLDLSEFNRLVYLYVYENQLDNIDLTNAVLLKEIHAYNNPRCNELIIKQCNELQKVYMQNCALESLDLSSTPQLKYLQIFNNQLKDLNVSALNKLESVYAYGNKLTKIDVSNCTALVNLDVANNLLAELNITGLEKLSFLKCSDNALTFATLPKSKIASYNFAPQASVEMASCSYKDGIDLRHEYQVTMPGDYPETTQFNWFNTTAGEEISIPDTLFTDNGNGHFTVNHLLSGYDIRCKLTNAAFPGLTLEYNLKLTEPLNSYSTEEVNYLRTFLQHESQEAGVTNAEKIGLHPSDIETWNESGKWIIRLLNLGALKLVEEKNTGERFISELFFYNGHLGGELIMPASPALKKVDCSFNSLTNITFSNSPILNSLSCDGNELTSLDVSKLTGLTYLSCGKNHISSLDFQNHNQLDYLVCRDNELTELNVTGCPKLGFIDCTNNLLKTLDLKNNPNLRVLVMNNNCLSELDLSNNPNLTNLYGSYNRLKSISLQGNNPNFEDLILDHNQLETTSLNMMIFERLDLSYNKLKFSTMPKDIFWKHYYYIPQDTINLGEVPCNSTVDLTAEYMERSDGTHAEFSWQEQVGSEWTETDKVIVSDDKGLFTFREDAVGKRFRCLAKHDTWAYGLILEFYVDIVKASSSSIVQGIQFAVYPNPVTDLLQIKSDQEINVIRLLNTTGGVVEQIEKPGSNAYTLNMTNYNSGIYFIEVNGKTLKVLKR